MDRIANDNLLDTAHSDVPYETEKTLGHIDQRAPLLQMEGKFILRQI